MYFKVGKFMFELPTPNRGAHGIRAPEGGVIMRRILILVVVCLFVSVGLAAAQSETEQEVKQSIIERYEFMNENSRAPEGVFSSLGGLAFWSSGGLIQRVPPASEQTPEEYEAHNVLPKHIEVISLIDGQVAVAHFYAEGSLKPIGAAPVGHYLVRVTEVFVKEEAGWRVRSSHWSPIAGGSGTSLTAVPVQ
jgi:hypothetical protein